MRQKSKTFVFAAAHSFCFRKTHCVPILRSKTLASKFSLLLYRESHCRANAAHWRFTPVKPFHGAILRSKTLASKFSRLYYSILCRKFPSILKKRGYFFAESEFFSKITFSNINS